ncbi:MAG TPA: GyrI-like domain-containing protein [Bdellovibrio sp.]|nr:GyrI-like domain-containing protein [Bdellovibrio sp.]
MKYVLLFVIAAIVSFGLYLSSYLGAFKSVEISQGTQGPMKIVYIDHVGPYHKMNKDIEVVENFFKSLGKPCGRTFGEYLDDPQVVEEARLRAKAGCVVDEIPANLPADFKSGEFTSGSYVIAIFTGSPGIGPLKVYPKVNDFMKDHHLQQNGAVIEIYEIHSITEKNAMTTTYLFPVR